MTQPKFYILFDGKPLKIRQIPLLLFALFYNVIADFKTKS